MATKVKSCKLKFKHGEETFDANHPIQQCVILKQAWVTTMVRKQLMTNLQHIQIISISHTF